MKRTLALVLALVMILACLTGCGSKTEESAPAAETTTAKSAAPAENTEESAEIVNIVVMARNGMDQLGEADVIAALNEYSAEKIGVTITFQPVASAEFADTLSRKLAAKDDLDVFWCNYANGYSNLVSKGAILDITDYVLSEEFSALYNTMSEDVWEAASFSGRYYGVYNLKETPYQEGIITPVVLADTIKEKYGVDFNALDDEINCWKDLPKLEAYLDACVAEGIKYPYIVNELEWMGTLLMSDPDYELVGFDSMSPFVMNKETHEVTNIFANADFEDWFKMTESWYEKGYISEDNIPTEVQLKSELPNDNWGLYTCSSVPDNANQQSVTAAQPVYAINSTIAVTGTKGARASEWCVAANSPKAEAAMKWIQLVETDKTYADMYLYGIEGVNYTRDSEDVITKIPDSGWALTRWCNTNINTPSITSSDDPNLKTLYAEFNDSGIRSALAGFEPDYSEVESEMAAISAIINEVFHLYATGVMTIEDVPETLEQLNQAGAEKVIATLQAQIDAYYAG